MESIILLEAAFSSAQKIDSSVAVSSHSPCYQYHRGQRIYGISLDTWQLFLHGPKHKSMKQK